MTMFKNFLRDESGASAAEYAIIIAIIGAACRLPGAEGLDALFRAVERQVERRGNNGGEIRG